MNFRASLPDKNVACQHKLPIGTLCPQALGFAITAVLRGTDTLFMSEQLDIHTEHLQHLLNYLNKLSVFLRKRQQPQIHTFQNRADILPACISLFKKLAFQIAVAAFTADFYFSILQKTDYSRLQNCDDRRA